MEALLEGTWNMMILKLVINLIFTLVLVRGMYYPSTKNKSFSFSYVMISVVVFFLCFALRKMELDMGMALGMFAIFAIIRYRTAPIPVKEMTYLFMVIGIAVINGLANDQMPIGDILFANLSITITALLLEKVWINKGLRSKNIVYEKIKNIVPQRRAEMLKDLIARTGLQIEKVEIGKIDFLKKTAQVKVYYNLND